MRLPMTMLSTTIPMTLGMSIFLALPSAHPQSPDENGGGSAPLVCPQTITGGIYIAGCLPSVRPPVNRVDDRGRDQVPLLYGVPCTGSNIGKCIGLSRLPTATPT